MPDARRILLVDDEASVLDPLARFLVSRGFAVDTATSGRDALARLRQVAPDIMLLDVRMPGMSGIDVVPEALRVRPDLSIVMLSAMADATTAALCMQRGAVDYLTKPIELNDLAGALDRIIRQREAMREEAAATDLDRRKLEQVADATLQALVNAQEAKDPYLGGHSARVATLAAGVATEMGLSLHDVELVRRAGRLHDIGKIGIRESVLNKRGPLTADEFQHIKEHVVIGWQILVPLTHLGNIAPSVRSHHENWDGTGYPDGLKGEAIPLGGRILCAAEIHDALTTDRPYQVALALEDAARRMRQLTGTVIDPRVMDALEASLRRRQVSSPVTNA